jgi:hypothetical protein
MDANLSNPQSAPKVNDDRRGTSRSGGSPAGFERPDPMRDQMEVALDQADRLLNEARSRVNDLRTTSTNSDLAQAIARLGATMATVQTKHCATVLILGILDFRGCASARGMSVRALSFGAAKTLESRSK